ncbi:MAG: flagellar export protein FliJ [Porticoccaceae bacterium]|nr:flagellar export protein FliJ [Porticoccaceae bacterium]
MKKSQRLQKISQVAENREQQSGQQLAQSRHHADAQQQQLVQLRQYRDEYQQQFQQLGGQGINARQLADFRNFLNNLNNAIGQQEQAVSNCQQNLENHHRLWLEAHQRVKALNKAVAKRRADEIYAHNRQEQLASDEHGMRRRSHKSPTG